MQPQESKYPNTAYGGLVSFPFFLPFASPPLASAQIQYIDRFLNAEFHV
jgi:hypothetical protein